MILDWSWVPTFIQFYASENLSQGSILGWHGNSSMLQNSQNGNALVGRD